MKRAPLLLLGLLPLGLALVARAADKLPSRSVNLRVEITTADGEPANVWAAMPPTMDKVQDTAAKEGQYQWNENSPRASFQMTSVERTEQRAPEGALTSTATELSAKEKHDLARFLEPEKGNEPDEAFRKLAAGIAPGEKAVIKVARAIYEHVLANMKYDKPADKTGWGLGSVQWACSEKYGNCTDFHALFMNLCRVRGIPARFTMGLLVPKEKKGTITGYHCWCEFYVAGSGWVPVDCSEASNHPDKKDYYFGTLDENRIAFVRGRDLTLDPAQKAGPVSILPLGYAERDGKPVAIKREIRYEDAR